MMEDTVHMTVVQAYNVRTRGNDPIQQHTGVWSAVLQRDVQFIYVTLPKIKLMEVHTPSSVT
jgi:hypothetical protein